MKRLLLISVLILAVNKGYSQDSEPHKYFAESVEEVLEFSQVLQKGDILILEDGHYKDIKLTIANSGVVSDSIKIMAKNPGKVIFSGDVKVELLGSYIVFEGVNFKDGARNQNEWKSHGPGLVAIYGSHNRVTQCAFDAFDEADSAYITTSLDSVGNVPQYCKIDHCSFTNKTTFDQVINLNNTLKKTLEGAPGTPMYHTIEYCYFSNPKKKGNAGGGIRIGYWRKDLGRCLIQYNVFDRQDSEPEIITSKSQENVFYYNTYKNCRGTLNFRHGDAQVAINNFFISTDDLYEYGGMFVWGSRHLIASNYFQLNTTIKSRGNAALYLNSGVKGDEHALAFDIDVYNNVFSEVNGSFIDFLGLKERRIARCKELGKTFEVPQDIRLKGNVFLAQNSSYPKFKIDNENSNIQWLENFALKKEENFNLKKIKKAVTPAFYAQSIDKIYAIDGIHVDLNELASRGLVGSPLTFKEVGPTWLKTNPSVYAETGKLTKELKERLKRNKEHR